MTTTEPVESYRHSLNDDEFEIGVPAKDVGYIPPEYPHQFKTKYPLSREEALRLLAESNISEVEAGTAFNETITFTVHEVCLDSLTLILSQRSVVKDERQYVPADATSPYVRKQDNYLYLRVIEKPEGSN